MFTLTVTVYNFDDMMMFKMITLALGVCGWWQVSAIKLLLNRCSNIYRIFFIHLYNYSLVQTGENSEKMKRNHYTLLSKLTTYRYPFQRAFLLFSSFRFVGGQNFADDSGNENELTRELSVVEYCRFDFVLNNSLHLLISD